MSSNGRSVFVANIDYHVSVSRVLVFGTENGDLDVRSGSGRVYGSVTVFFGKFLHDRDKNDAKDNNQTEVREIREVSAVKESVPLARP